MKMILAMILALASVSCQKEGNSAKRQALEEYEYAAITAAVLKNMADQKNSPPSLTVDYQRSAAKVEALEQKAKTLGVDGNTLVNSGRKAAEKAREQIKELEAKRANAS